MDVENTIQLEFKQFDIVVDKAYDIEVVQLRSSEVLLECVEVDEARVAELTADDGKWVTGCVQLTHDEAVLAETHRPDHWRIQGGGRGGPCPLATCASAQNALKVAIFRLKIEKIFWGKGNAPSPDPS